MTEEAWRKANHMMPDVMRVIFTSDRPACMMPEPGRHRTVEDGGIYAIIGPFDGFMGQRELQDQIEELVRSWNAKAAQRALADS